MGMGTSRPTRARTASKRGIAQICAHGRPRRGNVTRAEDLGTGLIHACSRGGYECARMTETIPCTSSSVL